MGRKREEVGKEVVHLGGADKAVFEEIVCWCVNMGSCR